MPPLTTSAPGVRPKAFRFRCIACGDLSDQARQDFRCAHCGDLLEITYPHWKESGGAGQDLKSTWSQRRLSQSAIDLSGVWRFRDVLPGLENDGQAITLREGNTPLYELPQCARITGVPRLFAKHQGLNPTGSFKDAGMTVAATFARLAGFRWVACASTTAASKLAMRRFRMSPISSLRIAIARCVPDLRSGHRGLKLLKMAANAVVDDAIAHPDLKSADEGGIVDGLEADWMRQAHRQHPLDPPLGRPVEGHGGPRHDADDAGRRVDHDPVLGDHVRDEPEAPMSDEQPDQVAGGRRHPLEEPLHDRAAVFQGHPWVGHDRPDPRVAEDVASPLQLGADGVDTDPLTGDLVAGRRVAAGESGGHQLGSGGGVIAAGSPATGASAR